MPGAILTSTLVNFSISRARLTSRQGNVKSSDMLVLDLPRYEHISILAAILTSTLVNLHIILWLVGIAASPRSGWLA